MSGCPKSPARQAQSDVAALRVRVASLEASHAALEACVAVLERVARPKWIEPEWKRQERRVPSLADFEGARVFARYGHIGRVGGRKHREGSKSRS